MHIQHVAPHFSCGQVFEASALHIVSSPETTYLFEPVCRNFVNGVPSRALTSDRGCGWLCAGRATSNATRRRRCRRASKSWRHSGSSSLYPPVHESSRPKNLLLSNPSRSHPSRHTRVNISNACVAGQAVAPDPTCASGQGGARC